MSNLATLAQRLGLSEASAVLREALTHSSYAAEHATVSNERLEFLGDAVVDLAIADHIVHHFPDYNEGEASVLRSRVVNEAALADAARRLELGRVLRVGRGVVKENGLERDSLLADAFEAVVAALYVDQGFAPAKDFVLEILAPALEVASRSASTLDAKTRLRQWADATGLGAPSYDVVAVGPSHDVVFEATVTVGGFHASGSGRSKKRAEASAAEKLWEECADA